MDASAGDSSQQKRTVHEAHMEMEGDTLLGWNALLLLCLLTHFESGFVLSYLILYFTSAGLDLGVFCENGLTD